MIKLGERRTVYPVTFTEAQPESKKRRPMTGRVVYIHPRRRFCTLEFDTRGGPIRESFQLIEGEIAE